MNKIWRKKIGDVENKMPDIIGSVTTTVLNTKIGEVQDKFLVVTNLVTTNVLETTIKEVEDEDPNFSDLVKKRDYDAKISDIERKYFTTPDYNKFTSDIIDTKIKQKELIDKFDISNLVKDSDLNTNLAT